MKPDQERPQTALYLCLLAIQIAGALVFVWQQLPEFRQVVTSPGEQLPKDASSDLMMAAVLLVMQAAFWVRLLRIPIPFRRPNVFLHHLFLFFGRLSFIFGSALFSVVVFRHLPEARPGDRLPSDGPARVHILGMPVRAVLHQPRSRTAGPGVCRPSKLSG